MELMPLRCLIKMPKQSSASPFFVVVVVVIMNGQNKMVWPSYMGIDRAYSIINYVNEDINLLQLNSECSSVWNDSDRPYKKYDRNRTDDIKWNWLFDVSLKWASQHDLQCANLKQVHLQIIYAIWMCVLHTEQSIKWTDEHNSVANATTNNITGLIYAIIDFYNFNWFSATKTESINKTTMNDAL